MALRLTANNSTIGVIEVAGASFTMGRHPDNDLSLRDDLASRFHCSIELDESGRWVLADLGSRNGTRLNGERVGTQSLRDGDVITVGRHAFTVGITKEAAPSTTDGLPSLDALDLPAPQPLERTIAAPVNFDDDDEVPLAEAPRGASVRQSRRTPEQPVMAGVSQRKPDRRWVQTVRTTLDALPPKTSADEQIVILDPRGNPTASLASEADGPMAVRLLLLLSSKSRATDIHVEPKGDAFAVRMRIDGQMVPIVDLPNEVGELIAGLIKTACQMKQAGREAVLDGSFSSKFNARRVDFRASFTPTVHGQKLVLRVLDARIAPQRLGDMNMASYMQDRIRKLTEQDTGLLLTCGPTGSGKTTTLYNALREIDRESRNVVTIEDPVEYHLDNVTQIPISANSSFPQILRSVLRQDPDVILVGEIRDEETARVAMQAAMTGHVVFTTVHAKDSIGAVFRLLDLGVERYLVANSLDLILAQRLVRVLCNACKRPVQVSPGQSSQIGRFLEGKSEVFAATGCVKCLRTGYFGRQALFEMLDFTNDLRDIVLNNPTIQAMRRKIEEGVFTTLQQSGWLLAARGVTSLDEVERVAGSGG